MTMTPMTIYDSYDSYGPMTIDSSFAVHADQPFNPQGHDPSQPISAARHHRVAATAREGTHAVRGLPLGQVRALGIAQALAARLGQRIIWLGMVGISGLITV